MGTPVVTNIIKSGAWLYVAPVAEANPDETTIDYGDAWGGNWERMGYTKAALTMAYDSEEFDVEVEEELAPVKRFRVKENLTLETVLAELTAEYLRMADSEQDTVDETAAGAAQDAYEEVGMGGVFQLAEKKWGFEGLHVDTDGADQPVRIFVHKGTAKVNGALEFSQKSTDYPGIALQVKALTDASQDAGQKLCMFQRVTGEKTG